MLRKIVVLLLLVTLAACSSTNDGRKGVYKTEGETKKSPSLQVPPDLSEPIASDKLAVPSIDAPGSTYSAYTNTEQDGGVVLAAKPKDVSIHRDGSIRWLEVDATPEVLWQQLLVFFKDVGFEIKREDRALGIMETNWVENRANLPTNWFSKLLHKLYSSGLMDKYRARLEKADNPKHTLLFITHQGLKEVGTDESSDVKELWWEPRKSDPELEAEMLERFLVFRGVGEASAKEMLARASVQHRAEIITQDDEKLLRVKENFARTWRRVGIALDRIGFLVEDRNRSAGLYYIRLSEELRDHMKEQKGWFASLFSDNDTPIKDQYLINVTEKDDATLIGIYEQQGKKAAPKFVEKLLGELKQYLE